MNNSLAGANPTARRFVGAGTKLYSVDQGLIDTGYSGNPLSLVVWRPDQSVEPWMYVGDSARMRKCRMDGATQTNYSIGIAPPTAAPLVQGGVPLYVVASDFTTNAGWTQGGTAGAPTEVARDDGATIVGILGFNLDPFTALQGWCNISPFTFTNPKDYKWIGVGSRLVIGGGTGTVETVTVQEVHTQISSSTVLGIQYLAGTSGECTIQAADPLIGLSRNSMVKLAGGEVPYVLSVTVGPDGLYSFRTVTLGTIHVGDTIAGVPSFRAYLVNPGHLVNETITAASVKSQITKGIGTITFAGALDLSKAGGRPLAPEDYLHISLLVDNPANLTEGRVLIDVDATTNDFAHNLLYFAFRAADSTAALTGGLTSLQALQTAAQNVLIGEVLASVPSPQFINATDSSLGTSTPNVVVPDSEQLFAGNSAWTEIMIPLSALQRVGADGTRSIANVNSIQLYFSATATINVQASAWWLGGTYGPDTFPPTAQPLLYRYRYRSTLTGAKSQQSPGTRANIAVAPDGKVTGFSSGAIAYRQQTLIYPTLSTDPQVNQIDIERFGGVLNEWHYAGTVPNTGTPVFADSYSDDQLKNAPALETDAVMPFASFDVPKTGTCNVVGTQVTKITGDAFSMIWAPGQEILINGIAHIVYGQPSSTTALSTVENVGVLTGVPFLVAEPTLIGQPLPHIIGPIDSGFLIAWGDPRNPGVVYATKGNDPDSAPINYYLELTTPSEPLVGGVVWDNNAIVFSTTRAFRVGIDANAIISGQGNVLTKTELQVGRGLFAPWAICAGPLIWFLAEDGVPCATDGSRAVSLVEDDLRPLFPHDGQPGVAVNGYFPPDLTQTAKLRFAYVNGMVRFDYQDTSGAQRTMIYNPTRKGWLPWNYAVYMNLGYWEEGQSLNSELLLGQDGNVYQVGGFSDNGVAISCEVDLPYIDSGNPRTTKSYGDAIMDADPQGVANLQVVPKFNTGALTLAAFPMPGTGRQIFDIDINTGLGQLALNIGAVITWSSSTSAPVLYEWQPWFTPKVETTILRATDWDDAGSPHVKWVQGVRLRADTLNVARTVQVLYDGAQVGATMAVQHAGEQVIAYSFPIPFAAHLLKLLPTDGGDIWRLYQLDWIYEPIPELATNWIGQGMSFGLAGWLHARDGYLPLWGVGPGTATLVWSVDGVALAPFTFPITAGYQKLRLDFPPNKGLLYQPSLTATVGVRVVKKDMEFRVKSWGSGGPYQTVRPFGDVDGETGARI